MTTGLTQTVRWIAVTDNLPGTYIPVLLAFPPGEPHKAPQAAEGWWSGSAFITENYGILVDTVTHWAALPDPPAWPQMARVRAEIKARRSEEVKKYDG